MLQQIDALVVSERMEHVKSLVRILDRLTINVYVACTLKQAADGTLSGTCKGTQAEDAAATGSVTGTTITIAYDTTYQGSPVHLAYAGDVQTDGTAKGTVDTGGPAGTFTLTK